MARTFTYLGEAEQIVPFTVDGPRVVSAGDQIRVADGDESFDEHPLWEESSPARKPAPVPVVDPVVPVEPDVSSEPAEPGSEEPTA